MRNLLAFDLRANLGQFNLRRCFWYWLSQFESNYIER